VVELEVGVELGPGKRLTLHPTCNHLTLPNSLGAKTALGFEQVNNIVGRELRAAISSYLPRLPVEKLTAASGLMMKPVLSGITAR
jgi:hypothetical protein